MTDNSEVLADLIARTPRNFAVQDRHGRTLVVIQALNEAVARHRVILLRDEMPRLPREFIVTPHSGPARTAWYSQGWFELREDLARRDGLPRCAVCGSTLSENDE